MTPAHILTVKPTSTQEVWSTDPTKTAPYEPTTSFQEASAVKLIYTFDYVLDQPVGELPSPGALAKPPRRALETSLATYSRPPRVGEYLAVESTTPRSHWISESIRGGIVQLKEHISKLLPGMVPTFFMIAWLQFHYFQYIRSIAMAENLKLMGLRLTNHAKDRQVDFLRKNLRECGTTARRAANVAEKAEAALRSCVETKEEEIARLQSVIVEGEQALEKEQKVSKENREKAAKDYARLDSSVKEKTLALDRAKAKSTKALEKAKDDGAREAKRLTDLANEKDAETARRRKADKDTITQLEARIVEVDNLREIAEAKTSRKEALIAEAVRQQRVAEETATQHQVRAAQAEKSSKAAEEKTRQEASKRIGQLKGKDEKIATLRDDLDRSSHYLQGCLDTANTVNEGMKISLAEARDDALKADADAKKTQEALQERLNELEKQHRQTHTQSPIAAPGSDISPREPSPLAQMRPVVRLPGSNSGQGSTCPANIRPAPRWNPPAEGTTKTPPEERGLPANTPTGPKSERPGRRS